MAEEGSSRQLQRRERVDRQSARPEQAGRARDDGRADQEPDVLLDVPLLKVDEINLEVEDLQARVSLQAQVHDLLKLHVGADVSLGRVSLDIKGVEAAALLKVHLDNVSAIINRVMATLDENPQMLGELSRGVSETVGSVGRGSGQALEEVGHGTGGAVEQVGEGAGGAVGQVGQGAGSAARPVADEAAKDAGDVVGNADQTAGGAGKAATAGEGRAGERAARPRRGVPSGRRIPARRQG